MFDLTVKDPNFSEIINNIKIFSDPLVYAPDEDTFIIAKIAYNLAFGRILEVGAGSGYTSIILAKKGLNVSCLDINENAISLIKKNSLANNVKLNVFYSDLFENVKEKYDTIIFNPPYLPESMLDQSDPFVKSVDGGKKGYEVTKKFIDSLYGHLTDNGQALIIFSSLTNLDMIKKFVMLNKMFSEVIFEKKVGLMEKLYVLKITKFPEIVELEKKGIRDIKFFTKGKRGYIFTGNYQNKKVGIKIKNPDSVVNTIFIEANNLKVLNKENIGPKLVLSCENYFVYTFIEGKTIGELKDMLSYEEKIKVCKKVFTQLRELDVLKYNKEEMTNPHKHIIIDSKLNTFLLDFERCKKGATPQNVTQFAEYVSKKILEKKDSKKIIELSKIYKKNYLEKDYENLINYLCS